MKVAIIGTGYVGLPTGAGLASLGHEVCCIDCDRDKVERLRAGQVPLFEAGLEDLLREGVASGKLRFTDSMSEGVRGAKIVLLAVGTPENPETGEANLDYLFAATKEMLPHIEKSTIVAIKSTVPVGTGDRVESVLPGNEVVSLPEFLREGYALQDFFHPDRIIVGAQDESAYAVIRELYAPMRPIPLILRVSRRSSETIKYASNAFLAVKIHYINEMADFCGKVGANINEVAQGMGLDSRIGSSFLKPGPGYGGSCFPKDTKAIEYMGRRAGVELSLIRAAIAGNQKRSKNIAQRILKRVEDETSPRIAIWGLAFKAGTDDVRESPAIGIVQHLLCHPGVTVVVHDPKALNNARSILGDRVIYDREMYNTVQQANILIILTEWPQFSTADWGKIKRLMKGKVVFDFRHIINPADIYDNGLIYTGI